MRNAFASILQARPCPTFGRPVRPGIAPSATARYFSADPSDSASQRTPCPPRNCDQWLQVHLGCVRLSLSCPFRFLHTFLPPWPARRYSRFWIRRPSSERRRDLNPPDSCAAQRTLRVAPTSRRPSRRTSFPSFGGTALCSVVRVSPRCRHPPCGPGLFGSWLPQPLF